jgi:hypothetical protein
LDLIAAAKQRLLRLGKAARLRVVSIYEDGVISARRYWFR